MRRLSALILAMIFLLSFCITAYANLDDNSNQTDVSVYAKYVDETKWDSAPVEEGKAEVTLPDGTDITVEDIEDNSWKLVVYEIPDSDKEAFEWISALLKEWTSDITPYHIYFVDEDENKKEANGVVIKFSLSDESEDVSVYAIQPDGTVNKLEAEITEDELVFEADGSPYYVLGSELTISGPTETPTPSANVTEKPGGSSTEKPSDSSTKEPTDTSGSSSIKPTDTPKASGSSSSPKTEDETRIWPWLMMMTVAVVVVIVNGKRKENEV